MVQCFSVLHLFSLEVRSIRHCALSMILSRPNIISLSQYSSGSKVYKNKTYKTRALKYFRTGTKILFTGCDNQLLQFSHHHPGTHLRCVAACRALSAAGQSSSPASSSILKPRMGFISDNAKMQKNLFSLLIPLHYIHALVIAF